MLAGIFSSLRMENFGRKVNGGPIQDRYVPR